MQTRLTSKTWTSGSTAYSTTYTYKNHPTDSTLTSTQLTSIQNGTNPSISYLYDANGNITSITEGTNTIQYIYNELNEVIRENNQRDNKTFVYNYDLGGNLLSKVEYAYTTDTLGTPVDTIPYVYGDTNWKDLVTSFDGKAITYDAIGNPLTYDGGTYAWEGRKLTSFNKTGLAVSYTYNESGIRTSKTVNGLTTNYRLSGDRVTFEQTGSDTIYYVYDTQGQLISMILNGTEYAYVRNAQNDVVGLVNSAGTQVVKYKYSTWGEVTLLEDTSTVSLGTKNPYLYRGYRYDSETGLYYLQSRYYNPQWGRFLNADTISALEARQDEILGVNLFVYCDNNPVNFFDSTGEILISTCILLGILVGSLIGGTLGGLYGYNKARKAGIPPKERWKYVVGYGTGGLIVGGIIGGFIGYGIGFLYGATSSSGIALNAISKATTSIMQKTWGHILTQQHAWNLVLENITQNGVKSIISQVLQKGVTTIINTTVSNGITSLVYESIYSYMGQQIVVRYAVIEGLIKISDAWVKTR